MRVVIPICPVLGRVIIALSSNVGIYPLLWFKVGFAKYAVPVVEVKFALYNLNFKIQMSG